MINQLIFYILATLGFIYMIHMACFIVGANIYDIFHITNKSKLKGPHRRKPLVSIIIPAHNEQFGITRTLESVLQSSYRKIEIVIIDDGSTDKTVRMVRKFIKSSDDLVDNSYYARWRKGKRQSYRLVKAQLGDIKITLVSQDNTGKAAAVNNGIKNYASGNLVMTLDADSTIKSDAIKNTVRYFEDKRIAGVAANVRVADSRTILAVLQKMEHMIGYRSKKFYTVTNCEFIVGGVASTYRMSTLREVGYYDTDTQTEDIGLSMKIILKKGNQNSRIIYASDVVAGTEGVQSYNALFKQRYRWKLGMLQNLIKNRSLFVNNDFKYSRMLTMYRIPMAYFSEIMLLVEPVLLAYLIYLSIINGTPQIFLGAYLTLTVYILWTLIPDEHASLGEKVKYGLMSPFMYFIFYIMNMVQLAAVIRCIFNYKILSGQVKTDSVWKSPERAAART